VEPPTEQRYKVNRGKGVGRGGTQWKQKRGAHGNMRERIREKRTE